MIDQDDIHRARILLVDADAPARQALADLLAEHGYTAVTGTGDARAVAALHAATPFDLILLDLDDLTIDRARACAAAVKEAKVLCMLGFQRRNWPHSFNAIPYSSCASALEAIGSYTCTSSP